MLTSLVFLGLLSPVAAQDITALRHTIEEINAGNKATLGVSIIGNEGKDTLSINGDGRFAMQSVSSFILH